jgi:hypothetical protein
MPNVQTSELLFAAGYTAWIISTFAVVSACHQFQTVLAPIYRFSP